jgi:hypothetical protein
MEGYLESRVGHGTIVSRQLPESLIDDPHPRARDVPREPGQLAPSHPVTRDAEFDAIPHLERIEGSGSRAFIAGQPPLDLFPYPLWARLLARRARQSACSRRRCVG